MFNGKRCLGKIHCEIKDHAVFQSSAFNQQKPIIPQLSVALAKLGSKGTCASCGRPSKTVEYPVEYYSRKR
jgi:hypothetical protein